MDRKSPAAPRIALLVLPETTPATLYSLHEVLVAVGGAWETLTGEATGVAPFEVRIVSRGGEPVATVTGPTIAAEGGLDDADVVILTDLVLSPDFSAGGRWAEEAAWLRAQYERGATICSVCTGSMALAEAGLLDGHVATTHWSAARLMQENYPEIRVEASRILVPSGEGHRIITSGGVASWEDLALYLIGRFRGGGEAVRISKIFVLGDRSEGQLPFAAAERPRNHDDAAIAELQVWLADNYGAPNPVREMARRSGMQPRTLARRFRAATGYSPIEYLQTLRLEEAKQLLETTKTRVEEIPGLVGYEDPAYFRRLFRKRTGTTLAKYRRRFAGLGGGMRSDAG